MKNNITILLILCLFTYQIALPSECKNDPHYKSFENEKGKSGYDRYHGVFEKKKSKFVEFDKQASIQ